MGLGSELTIPTCEMLPPLDVDPFAEELECPHVVAGLGRYYLVFSTLGDLLRSAISRAATAPGGNMYAMVGPGDPPIETSGSRAARRACVFPGMRTRFSPDESYDYYSSPARPRCLARRTGDQDRRAAGQDRA